MSVACHRCSGPAPCDCWKAALTPEQREARQLELLGRFVRPVAVVTRKKGCGKRGQIPAGLILPQGRRRRYA